MESKKYLTKNDIEPLINDKYVKLENGLIYINDKGEGFRLMKYGYGKIHISYINGYKITTVNHNGIQENYYLHKLVAEAFVKKPIGYKNVIFKDGNRNNIHHSNLEWIKDVSATLKRARTKKYEKPNSCTVCGKDTHAHNNQCSECNRIDALNIKNKEIRILWLQKIRDEVNQFRKLKLTSVQKETLDLREKGMTYDEIAIQRGVTRQAVGVTFDILKKHNGSGRI